MLLLKNVKRIMSNSSYSYQAKIQLGFYILLKLLIKY